MAGVIASFAEARRNHAKARRNHAKARRIRADSGAARAVGTAGAAERSIGALRRKLEVGIRFAGGPTNGAVVGVWRWSPSSGTEPPRKGSV